MDLQSWPGPFRASSLGAFLTTMPRIALVHCAKCTSNPPSALSHGPPLPPPVMRAAQTGPWSPPTSPTKVSLVRGCLKGLGSHSPAAARLCQDSWHASRMLHRLRQNSSAGSTRPAPLLRGARSAWALAWTFQRALCKTLRGLVSLSRTAYLGKPTSRHKEGQF